MEGTLSGRPPLDEQLDAVAHRERRRLLLALREIAPDERAPVKEFVADGVESPLVGLRHVHLPKLEDRGFIEWDEGARAVARGPAFRDIEPLLDSLAEYRDGRQLERCNSRRDSPPSID